MQCNWKETKNQAFNRLMNQFTEMVGRKARGGKLDTRITRFRKYKVFLTYVCDDFAPEDIKNIKPTHIAAFVQKRRSEGVKDITIVADLSVIRWWHEQIPWRKYEMPENSQIFLLEDRLNDKQFCEEFKNKYRRKRG